MNKTIFLTFTVLLLIVCAESKKFSWGRGSNSRRTSYKPAPTSSSGHAQSSILKPAQTSAQKTSFSGWQETPKQATGQKKPSQTHSYPSSQTGLSGSGNRKPPAQESVQRSSSQSQNAGSNHQQPHGYPASPGSSGSAGAGYPQQQGGGLSGAGAPPPYGSLNSGHQPNQPSHSYPASHGLSGTSGAGAGYPQQNGGKLSGGAPGAPPPYPGHPTNTGYNGGGNLPANNYHGNGYHHQPPPPPYSPGYGGHGGGGYGHGYHGAPGPQMQGYFGGYGNNGFGGGMSRPRSALSGIGIAGAGIGTVLTGLALWNLARSTGHSRHTVIYDNRGQPIAVAPNNDTATETVDPMLADLVNCTLTIAGTNATEVLAIPCAIATSFSPEANVQDLDVGDAKDSTKCTITVVTKTGREFMTTIPCSVLLSTAAENNVTEPLDLNNNGTAEINSSGIPSNIPVNPALSTQPQNQSQVNCTNTEPGAVRDPINPCFSLEDNVTVLPLSSSNPESFTTPQAA